MTALNRDVRVGIQEQCVLEWLQKEFDRLFERMEEVLNSYTDEDDGPAD